MIAKKYLITLSLVSAGLLGLILFILIVSIGNKQDFITLKVAQDIASKLEQYISDNSKIPQNLSELNIRDFPNTIKYTKLSDSNYEFCTTYKKSSTLKVFGANNLIDDSSSSSQSTGDSAKVSNLNIRHNYIKGTTCINVKPEINKVIDKPSYTPIDNNLSDNPKKVIQNTILLGTKLSDFTPTSKVYTLQIMDLSLGSGQVLKASDTVTVNYTSAYALSGVIFQSTYDNSTPSTFPLSSVIKGWSQGLPGMKLGGKRRLVVPSALAYANKSTGTTTLSSYDLVFDVELIGIK